MELKQQLKLKFENKKLKSRVNLLEKVMGETESFKELLRSEIKSKLNPIVSIIQKPLPKKSCPDKREIVVVLNDMHYGTFVNKEEVNGLNEYGWKQASRRTAAVIKQAIDFKPHNRDKVERVHLIINGDILGGAIHGLTTKTIDLMVFQLNGALSILSHAITALAKEFPEVVVHATTGNHEEFLHKREGGKRAITETYDSFANHIFFSLSQIFANTKHIKFNVSKGLFLSVNLLGGRTLVTHGHVLFSKQLGNPASSINTRGLSDVIHRFNLGEIKKKKAPFKLALFGHVHTQANFTTNDGVQVYVAPSLVGLDAYAASLGINNNFCGQLIFESVPGYVMGDSRLVEVSKYDNDSSLDNIIPIYKRTLKHV